MGVRHKNRTGSTRKPPQPLSVLRGNAKAQKGPKPLAAPMKPKLCSPAADPVLSRAPATCPAARYRPAWILWTFVYKTSDLHTLLFRWKIALHTQSHALLAGPRATLGQPGPTWANAQHPIGGLGPRSANARVPHTHLRRLVQAVTPPDDLSLGCNVHCLALAKLEAWNFSQLRTLFRISDGCNKAATIQALS